MKRKQAGESSIEVGEVDHKIGIKAITL
jgi:hypothetical protein